jgi:hypothetical protein
LSALISSPPCMTSWLCQCGQYALKEKQTRLQHLQASLECAYRTVKTALAKNQGGNRHQTAQYRYVKN